MKRLIEQLQSDEAVLLMYQAGELPEAEREEIAARLERDGNLRAQLERIREAESEVFSGLARLDESSRSYGQESAVKRVGGMMRQWQVDRIRAAAANGNGRRRMSGWMYSSAAAALILIGWVAWWGFTPATPFSDPATTPDYPDRVQLSDLMISAVQQDNVAALDRLGTDLASTTADEQSSPFWIDSSQDDDKPTG